MDPSTDPDLLDIRQPLRILLRNLWLPVLGAVLLGALAYANAARDEEVFASDAIVQIQDPTLGSTLERERVDPVRAVEIQVLYARSRQVLDEVRSRIGDDAPAVSLRASGLASADAIRLRAESSSPVRAQRTANTYALVYLEQRRAALADPLEAQAQRLREEAAGLQPQLQDLDRRIVDETPASTTVRVLEPPVLRGLLADRAALADRIAGLNGQAAQLDLEADVRRSQFEVVDAADLPEEPVRPNPLRDLAVGIVVGALLGAVLAFPFDRRRDLIWTTADVEVLGTGVPVLGVVPRRRFRRPTPVRFAGPTLDPAAEAYRLLRANLLFGQSERDVQSVLVTGPNEKDGKTSSAVNLGIALAHAGSSVALVDADLRSPSVHTMLGLDREPGLTDVLTGVHRLDGALREVELVGANHGPLHVLPSGSATSAPGEALLTPTTSNALTELRDAHEFVIVDGPPILATADSLNLGWLVDGVVVVIGAGRSRGKDLLAAVYRLQQVEAPIIGIVLHGGRLGQESRGYTGYGPPPQPRQPRAVTKVARAARPVPAGSVRRRSSG